VGLGKALNDELMVGGAIFLRTGRVARVRTIDLMIRRRHGNDFLLITQHDHALVAGQMAEVFGNQRFASPTPREQAIEGVKLHDCGWPVHDDEPTLNGQGLPLDVFETPRPIAFAVWTASVERAVAKDPYAGLLVSLHVLSLSLLATEAARGTARFDMENPQDRFAIIKFQQRELERQEDLRQRLGLRSEKATHKAVAKELRQQSEDQLQFNFAMLQVMDQLSLAACCTEPPVKQSRDLPAAPGGEKVKLAMVREGNDVIVEPWPFADERVELMIPATHVPGQAYRSEKELRDTIAAAPAEIISCAVRATGL